MAKYGSAKYGSAKYGSHFTALALTIKKQVTSITASSTVPQYLMSLALTIKKQVTSITASSTVPQYLMSLALTIKKQVTSITASSTVPQYLMSLALTIKKQVTSITASSTVPQYLMSLALTIKKQVTSITASSTVPQYLMSLALAIKKIVTTNPNIVRVIKGGWTDVEVASDRNFTDAKTISHLLKAGTFLRPKTDTVELADAKIYPEVRRLEIGVRSADVDGGVDSAHALIKAAEETSSPLYFRFRTLGGLKIVAKNIMATVMREMNEYGKFSALNISGMVMGETEEEMLAAQLYLRVDGIHRLKVDGTHYLRIQ